MMATAATQGQRERDGAATAMNMNPRRPRFLLRRRRPGTAPAEGGPPAVWELDMDVVRRRYGAPHPPRSAYLLFLQAQQERGRQQQHAAAASPLETWQRCSEQEKAAWVAKAMWERQRHARETAAYLLQQEQQRQQMRLEGGMLLEVDLGHCRPRSMLESAAAQDAMDAASPPGHNATKKKPALLSSLSLHAMAADGNLAGLGRRLNGKSFSPPTHEVEAQAWTEKSPPVGLSPLMLAVMCSDHATVDFLLSHGGCGDPRVGGGKGDMTVVVPSPAHVAAARDPSSLLSLLDLPEEGEGLRQEVLRATDATGRSLLHYAALGGNPQCVRLLLERGLSLDARDDEGHTPLDLAERELVPDIVEIANLLRNRRSLAAAAPPSSSPPLRPEQQSREEQGDGNGRGPMLKRRDTSKLRLDLSTLGDAGWLMSPLLASPAAAVGALAAWARGGGGGASFSKPAKHEAAAVKPLPTSPASPPPTTVVAIGSSPGDIDMTNRDSSSRNLVWNSSDEGESITSSPGVGSMGVDSTPVWCDEAERRQREVTLAKLAEERQIAEGLLLLGGRTEMWMMSSGNRSLPSSSDGGGDPAWAAAAMSTSTSSLLQPHGQWSEVAGVATVQQQQYRTMADRFTLLGTRRGATAAVAAVLVTCLMALPWLL